MKSKPNPRQAKPDVLDDIQIDLLTMSMDIAEQAFGFKVIEIIRIIEEFPDNYQTCMPCDHNRYNHDNKTSCFYCPSCNLMAETEPFEWPEELDGAEKYEESEPRLKALVQDFMKKPVNTKN